VLQYNLTSIPTNATVTTATLSFQKCSNNCTSHSGSKAVAIRRHTASWSESGATWNSIQPFSDSIVGSASINTSLSFPTVTDGPLKTLVQEWISNPSANNGIVIAPGSSEQTTISFYSKENGSGNPIRLSVTYTVPPPCTLNLTQPVGDETWTKGQAQNITWTRSGSGCSTTMTIELLKGGNLYDTISTGAIAGNNLFAHTPPQSYADGSDYKIRIRDNATSASSTSPANFNVVSATSPPQSSLRVKSGTLAEQALSPSNPSIVVTAGAPISGTFVVGITSTFPSNAVMSIGVTPSWGNHATSYTDLGHFSTPTTDKPLNVTVNYTAPQAPGTYYIVTAFNGEFNAGQVLSCTNWSTGNGSPVWDDGNDVAGWSAAQMAEAIANGRASGQVLYNDGMHSATIPATVITVHVATQSCTFSISPSSASAPVSGGSGSVSVSAANSCSWTAASSVSWISITSGSLGSGNGTVNYNVQQNSGAQRSGALTIAGQTFIVTQPGVSPVNAPKLDIGDVVGAPGSSVSIPVTLTSNGFSSCSTESTITYDASKLTFTGVTTGTAASAAGKEAHSSGQSAGSVKVSVFGVNSTTIGDGTVANLNFTVNAGSSAGSIAVVGGNCSVSDCIGNSAPSPVCATGTVTVNPAPCDCDGNGSLSISELQKGIGMYLGTIPIGCNCDCNGDQSISIGEIQRVIAIYLQLASGCL